MARRSETTLRGSKVALSTNTPADSLLPLLAKALTSLIQKTGENGAPSLGTKQGRQDLNPQPTVLETVALPA